MAAKPNIRRFVSIMSTSACLIVLLAGVLGYSLSPENSTRVRSSFLIEVAEKELFELPPKSLPKSFLLEDKAPPDYLLDVINGLDKSSPEKLTRNLIVSTKIAGYMIKNKTKGHHPIQNTTIMAFNKITTKGLGYCADYSQVFLALALAASIPSREWGVGFDGFGGGHAFNEIFEPAINQWVFIDPFHSFYLVDSSNKRPLSALEFQDRLLLKPAEANVDIVVINEDKHPFNNISEVFEYYRQGLNHFYLFWGNNVYSYDQSIPVKLFSDLSRALEVFSNIVTGIHPSLKVIPNEENLADIETLKEIKLMLIFAMITALILCIVLFEQIRGRNGKK